MSIRHLKTFIVVCDLGSISKASEQLHWLFYKESVLLL